MCAVQSRILTDINSDTVHGVLCCATQCWLIGNRILGGNVFGERTVETGHSLTYTLSTEGIHALTSCPSLE